MSSRIFGKRSISASAYPFSCSPNCSITCATPCAPRIHGEHPGHVLVTIVPPLDPDLLSVNTAPVVTP